MSGKIDLKGTMIFAELFKDSDAMILGSLSRAVLAMEPMVNALQDILDYEKDTGDCTCPLGVQVRQILSNFHQGK
jgi:hypothetical protein